MACSTKNEILKGYANKGYSAEQVKAIEKVLNLVNETPRVIKTSKGSVYWHATNDDWDVNGLRTDNELGFHVGTEAVANDYSDNTFKNSKKQIYMTQWKAKKDLAVIRLSDTTVEKGGWDVDNVNSELKALGVKAEGDSLQEISNNLAELGYDAIEYVNKGEVADGTVNSLIIVNADAVENVSKKPMEEYRAIKRIGLGSSKEAFYGQLGDRFPGAEKAYWNRKTGYKNRVVKEYRAKIGSRLGIMNDENDSMEFKTLRNVRLTLGSYFELIFDNGTITIDPETGMDIEGFKRIDNWDKIPMYRGSQANSEYVAFNDEIDLGVVGDVRAMKELIDELNALDPNSIGVGIRNHLKSVVSMMDPENLREMKMYLDKKAESTLGFTTNDKINIRIAKSKKMAGNTMSAAEVYVHELVHAYTMFALRTKGSKVDAIRRKLRFARESLAKGNDWHIFMPKESFDKVEEEANAKEMWKYVFENETDGDLDEFIAHVLSNPMLAKLAMETDVKERAESKNLYEWLMNVFGSIMDLVRGKFSYKGSTKRVYEEVAELVSELGNINNEAVVARNENQGVFNTIFRLLSKAEYKVSEAIKAELSKMEAKAEKSLIDDPMPRNGTKLEYAIWLTKWLPKLVLLKPMRPYLALVLNALGMKPEGTVQNVIRDFRNPEGLEEAIDKSIMDSGKIDRVRESIVMSVRKLIEQGFSKELGKENSSALTRVLLETDVGSIYEEYGSEKLSEMLDSNAILEVELAKAKEELKKVSGDNYYLNVNQAKSLGRYMVTGIGHEAQLANAENIVNNNLLGDREVNEGEIEAVDRVATLIALKLSNIAEKRRVAKLMRDEKQGVENVLEVHKNFVNESKEKLFDGNGTNMQKGYVKELFNDSIALEVAPVSSKSEMEQKGYTLAYELAETDFSGDGKKMAMYRSKNFNRSEYYRTATRLTSMNRKGVSIKSIAYRDGGEATGAARAKLGKAKADRDQARLLKKMSERELDLDEMTGSRIPLLNDSGKVVDYRYIMSKDMKEDLLEQDYDVGKVLGRSIGSVYDKVSTKEHNEKMLKMMWADMDENYVEGSQLGKNDMLYVKISEDSDSEYGREMWKLLPKDMKIAIEDREPRHLAIRQDMLLNYFGFRHLSLANSKIAKLLPKVVQTAIKFVEELWQAIVSVAKVDILIRVPAVIIGNVISNIMYAIMTYSSPVEILKMYIEQGRNISEYNRDNKEYNELIAARDSGNVLGLDISKIARLKRSLESNPIHELMELGIYESVVEDLGEEDVKSSNAIGRWTQERMEKLPGSVQTAWNWVSLNNKTGWYRNMEMMLRMGDLLAQAVQNAKVKKLNEKRLKDYQKKLRNENLPAALFIEAMEGRRVELDEKRIHDLRYDFVFYSKPSSSLEEYANRMGLMMFTKYAKRIQRIIGKTAIEHPFRAAMVMLGNEYLLDNSMDNIGEQSIMTRGWYNFGISPMDLLDRVVPIGVRLAYQGHA